MQALYLRDGQVYANLVTYEARSSRKAHSGGAVNLRTFLSGRGISQDAAGVLAGVDASTISRICAGQVKARPATIVKLSRALGVSAKRMQAMCEAHWLAAHPGEGLLVR